jgi:DNA-binding Lrp family transcriptional regulator
MQGKFAMSVVDVARNLKVSRRNAWRYISKLEADGLIYLRYRQRLNYYSIRRENEIGKDGSGTAQDQQVVWFRYD